MAELPSEQFPDLGRELSKFVDNYVAKYMIEHPEADPKQVKADVIAASRAVSAYADNYATAAMGVLAGNPSRPAETREMAEAPAFPTHIVSFALPGLKRLREELKLKPEETVIGVKKSVLTQYELKHGDPVLLTFDGRTVTPTSGLRVVDHNENGPVVELRLTKPIRDLRPGKIRDHRENGTDGKGAIDMGDYVTYSVIELAGPDGTKQKAIWIRVD